MAARSGSACRSGGGAADFALLGSAVRARRFPGAALDEAFGGGPRGRGGGPFPTVAPHVDGAAGGACFGIGLDGGRAVALAAVEVGVLGHVAGGVFPLQGRRQTVTRRRVLGGEPRAIGLGVGEGDVGDGVVGFARRRLAARPAFRRVVACGADESRVVGDRDGRAADGDLLPGADHRQPRRVRLAAAGAEAGIPETVQALLDAGLAVAQTAARQFFNGASMVCSFRPLGTGECAPSNLQERGSRAESTHHGRKRRRGRVRNPAPPAGG